MENFSLILSMPLIHLNQHHQKPPKNGRNNSSKKNLDDVTGSCDDYAGIHKIVWKDIKFPASGTYTVDIQVDDNVRLEIFNRKFRAQTLEVKGFRGPGKSNGKQTFTLEVQKGTYTIRAFLQQIPGKSIYAGNPMGLAINIKTAFVTVKKKLHSANLGIKILSVLL